MHLIVNLILLNL
ncbi:uncharacterized protein FFB14_14136 [Fusarium fujikuroi]|nr:uncharacterized protein FFB14_14136 [Fusarium fujikuroi]